MCETDSHDFDSIVLWHVNRVTCRADPVIECGRHTMFFLGGVSGPVGGLTSKAKPHKNDGRQVGAIRVFFPNESRLAFHGPRRHSEYMCTGRHGD